jgi:hypothetical protein
MLGPAPRPPHLPFAYLDAETTGLSGGTGTLAFAVAVSRPLEAGLEMTQLFLPEPAGEAAFLHALRGQLDGCYGIATYNGSRFDLPLLRGRWVMARLPGDFDHPPHLDLLTLTRALLRQRLESCALRTVEERLLRFQREDDLPGAMIPEVYFEYLRRGWSGRLEPALAHNRTDVYTLHHLHLRLLARLLGRDLEMEGPDWLALGRYLKRQGRRADAWRALRHAAELPGDSAAGAGLLLAQGLARRRRSQAADSLLAGIEARLPRRPELAVARAKLLEWRRRDPAGALEVVARALDRLAAEGTPAALADLERRRRRLSRRLASRAGSSGDDRPAQARHPEGQMSVFDQVPEHLDQPGIEGTP